MAEQNNVGQFFQIELIQSFEYVPKFLNIRILKKSADTGSLAQIVCWLGWVLFTYLVYLFEWVLFLFIFIIPNIYSILGSKSIDWIYAYFKDFQIEINLQYYTTISHV